MSCCRGASRRPGGDGEGLVKWDDGRTHRARGEPIAEQVGHAERNVIRIHGAPGAKERREDLVADEPEDPARHGGGARRRRGACDTRRGRCVRRQACGGRLR